MSNVIGGYRCLTSMQTAGSGSARWCIAARGMERFFLKEFLSPVYPAKPDTPLGERQLERCIHFEKRKQRLYAAASCVIGNVLVPVIDFFRSGSHYYAVSEAIPDGRLSAEQAAALPEEERGKLLFLLAQCLQRLHLQGIVHADLKPEHVLIPPETNGYCVKLIDLDSGFLMEDPPAQAQEMEGDPAYLAPEAFLRMTGREITPNSYLDTFSFGMLIHQFWTGKLPDFDHERYQYLYEAALDEGEIRLDLPDAWEPTVRRMLHADPLQRPTDAEITALLLPEKRSASAAPARNGLSRLLKV